MENVFASWIFLLKFIYSEKATKFCEIFTLLLSYVVSVKSKVKISQKFVAFSEYMNFNCLWQVSSQYLITRFFISLAGFSQLWKVPLITIVISGRFYRTCQFHLFRHFRLSKWYIASSQVQIPSKKCRTTFRWNSLSSLATCAVMRRSKIGVRHFLSNKILKQCFNYEQTLAYFIK